MIIDAIQRQQASVAAALGTTGNPGTKRFATFEDVTIGFGGLARRSSPTR